MKSMTCKELGGACDVVFRAESFEEIANLSKAHGTEMFKQSEPAHLEAMSKMQILMQNPGAIQQWFADKKAEFEALPDIQA